MKIDTLKSKLLECKKNKMRWRQAYKKLNIDRLSFLKKDSEKQKLKKDLEIYFKDLEKQSTLF
jgi:hypothetical protein